HTEHDDSTKAQDTDGNHTGRMVARSMDATTTRNPPLYDDSAPDVGDHIEIYWSSDEAYYTGSVPNIDDAWDAHVKYDDGDSEDLDLGNSQRRHASSVTI
ncbi:MAG: hypothetical protein AAF417_21010, partial [Pseudomonadota bacterium]